VTDLKDAYGLRTPADSVRLYRGWAADYDRTFAQAHGYVAPREVARAFLDEAGPDGGARAGPVLDIGAGTGLVAEHLRGLTVDAVDISQEMLDAAGAKGLYRRRIRADLTGPLPMADAEYSGFVSAGTFTHGHVGPACLPELMRIARPGAVFALSINAQAFDAAGFGSAFAGLVAEGDITPVRFRRAPIYEGATHEHARDTMLVALFRRCRGQDSGRPPEGA
jgi:predicted TPR repeat methyltransferase